LFSKFELKNLYIKGQEGDKFYIILSGEVGVFIQKEYKREEGVEELLSQKNLLKK
jgi:CRP-like cAMP-binding protein